MPNQQCQSTEGRICIESAITIRTIDHWHRRTSVKGEACFLLEVDGYRNDEAGGWFYLIEISALSPFHCFDTCLARWQEGHWSGRKICSSNPQGSSFWGTGPPGSDVNSRKGRLKKSLCVTKTTTATVLWPFFRDHPGEPVPEENFWTLWCKGRLTEADTLTIWLGATPSVLTSGHLHHSPIFLQAGCPSCRPTNSVEALKATNTKSTKAKDVMVKHWKMFTKC